MAIYSRRILQQLINENAPFLSKGQTKRHVQQLNRMAKEMTLAAEWEVVLLNALSKVGKVIHEKNFGGRRNADVYFEAFDDPGVNFVADITAISDKGADESNPYEAFAFNLYNRAREVGLRENSFNIRVGSRHTGPTFKGGPKVSLKLPGRARFEQAIFGKEFDAFLHRIVQNPHKAHCYEVKTDDADVEISYVPNQRYASGSHSTYTILHSLSENTVYQALESKASQLLGTQFTGHLGIFLCDGGSSLFSMRSTSGLSYTIDEVINEFLSNHQEIHFVVTYTAGRKFPYGTSHNVDHLYMNHACFYATPKYKQVTIALERTLQRMIDHLPFPVSEARNALYYLKGKTPDIGISKWGGMQMEFGQKTTKLKISARALAELLAGKVDQRAFFESHGFVPSELRPTSGTNPFHVALQRGELINNVSLEKSESEDDDWITFELKGPDPAIAPFKVPRERK